MPLVGGEAELPMFERGHYTSQWRVACEYTNVRVKSSSTFLT